MPCIIARLSAAHQDSSIYRGVAQLVARTAGGREVARSNRVVPTKKSICYNRQVAAH